MELHEAWDHFSLLPAKLAHKRLQNLSKIREKLEEHVKEMKIFSTNSSNSQFDIRAKELFFFIDEQLESCKTELAETISYQSSEDTFNVRKRLLKG